ncbi:MAG: LacI family DNA-binding transcriptional regulator [Ruminiclostridium sp.]
MPIGIKDVAKVANVSTATVSHVINGTRFVSIEKTDKVREAMSELNYHPNLIARSLRSQKSKTIGLLIPDISNSYYTGLAEGIEITLRKSGYHMILSNSHDKFEDEIEMIEVFNSLCLDGLIIIPALGEQNHLKNVLTGNYPVVFTDRKPRGIKGDCVVLENEKSTYEVIHLLISKGHKKIGLVTGDFSTSTTSDRVLGYKEAFNDNNLEVNESLIKAGDFSFDSGYEITKSLVKDEKVTALFYANDTMAVGGITYLKEEKIKIPEQVALIICNNFKWTQIINPPLSVVVQPSYELGQKAAEVLLSRINHPVKRTKFKEYRIPTSVVIRESC